MTLPRKHSRLIIVDERRFRWLVRPQGDRVRVAVQLESGAGRAIATGVREGVVVTPARVRTLCSAFSRTLHELRMMRSASSGVSVGA